MKTRRLVLMAAALSGAMLAGQQPKLGDGNTTALKTGQGSPLVENAMRVIVENVRAIRDERLREATLDAVRNPLTCVAHRARVTEEIKEAILAKLKAEGLVDSDIRRAASSRP